MPWSTKVSAYEARRQALSNERSEFLEEWQDISDHIQTRRGRFLVSENRKRRAPSQKLLNERGTFASRVCGAGMLAGVSSPSRPWLKLTTPDKDLNEWHRVKRWLDQLEKRVYQVFNASNFYHAKQASYRDMADYGQGPVIVDENFDNVINLYNSPPGEYYLSVDDDGIVDTMYRDLSRTTMQLINRFQGNCPREVRRAYDEGRYDDKWTIVAVVEPNFRRMRGMPGALGAAYSSVYYCLECEESDNNAVMEVSGRFENPISAPRWDIQTGDVYGDGPGLLVLPSTKSLQILERRKGQMIDKMAASALQAPDSMKNKVVDHTPGSVTYYPASMQGANAPIQPLYKVDPQGLNAILAEQEIIERRVEEGYFVPLFQAVINSDRREVTAREIEELHEEKLIALGPVLERTHYEGLNREVKRTIGILARHEIIPPPPDELDQMPLKIEYTSMLAVAQRAISARGMERFAGFVGNLVAGKPDIIDKWDVEQTVDEYADVTGVPAAMVRSDDEVEKLRADRRQQEQAMQAAAAAANGAQTAKVLSEADTGRGSNLLADIIGQQGRIV